MQRDDEDPTVGDLDAADEALVAKLRALPDDGGEPDWRRLEAAIRAQVAPLPLPLPWWRNWRWLVPIGALATTAAIVLVVAMQHRGSEPRLVRMNAYDAGMAQPSQQSESPVAAARATNAPAMWLDGEALELDDLDDAADDSLDALEGEAPSELRDVAVPEAAYGSAEGSPEGSIEAMLPVDGYGWIDSLDDEAAARVEKALEGKRS